MSYAIYTPCYGCGLRPDCKDAEKLQEAVSQKIHNEGVSDGTHKGFGTIALLCGNIQPIKPA